MSRLIKVVGLVLGVVVLLLATVLIGVSLLFDPNDYKDQITTAVADATGRDFTLEGDLSLGVFPRLSIEVGAAELGNAPGFGNAPFAAIDGARLQIGLFPLLSKRIEIDEARLQGLRVNLARNAAGVTNWQDIGAGAGNGAAPAAAAPADATPGSGAAALDLTIGAVQISNAEVRWQDALNDSDWLLTDFNLDADGFGPDRAFPVSIGFSFSGPDIKVTIDSEMDATVSLADNSYRLDGLQVTIDGEGDAWPGGSGEANLSFDSFTADLGRQTLGLEGLTLDMLGLEIAGNLTGQNLLDNLSLAGGIRIAEFDPNDLLAAFDTEIETADADVFRRASVAADFYYGADAMGLRNTEIRLDDSLLSGTVGLRGERLEFELAVDAINIDRYLPPAAEGETANADEGSIDEVDLPIDPLRDFVARGNLTLAETQVLGMTLTNARFALDANNGRLTLRPTGTLYGGSLNGEIGIQVQGDAARLGLKSTLAKVDLHGLARDFLKTEDLSGTGDVNLDLTAVGSNVGAIRRDLDGNVSFTLTDGAYEGIDAWYELRRAWNTVRRNPVPEREGPPRTTYSKISGTGVVEDALLTTNDLAVTLPFMAITGAGTVNLLTDEIDLQTTARFVDGPVLQSDPAVAELAGLQIKLPIGGSIGVPEPAYASALGSLAADIVRQAASQRVEEEKEQAREEVQQRVDEEREQLQDRVRSRLRNLLE